MWIPAVGTGSLSGSTSWMGVRSRRCSWRICPRRARYSRTTALTGRSGTSTAVISWMSRAPRRTSSPGKREDERSGRAHPVAPLLTMTIVIVGAMLAPWLFLLTARRGWHVWARNAFVRGAGAAVSVEPFMAPLALSVLLRWTDVSRLVPVMIWAAIFGVWFLGLALGPSGLVAAAWLTLALVNVGFVVLQCLGQRVAVPAWLADGVDKMGEGFGTFGHRTMCAGFLALVLPLCWLIPAPWRWLLVALLGLGLWLTSSWLAWLATLGALPALIPALWLPFLGLALLAVLGGCAALWAWSRAPGWYHLLMRPIERWTLRGASLDSVVQRLEVWRAYGRVWRRWPNWLLGRGDGSSHEEAVQVQAGVQHRMVGYPHNEIVSLAYEHGLFGLAALGLFAWRVVPALHAGDPWSAMVIAGGVLMLGMHTAHIAPLGGTWWLAAAMVAGR